MPFDTPLLKLISAKNGAVSPEFLATSAHDWAVRHMDLRYSAAPPAQEPREGPDHPAWRCYNLLLAENAILRSWVTAEGIVSPLLMARSVGQLTTLPIGDGFGWDFKPDGTPDLRMLQFKSTLIGCRRMAAIRVTDPNKLDVGSIEVGGHSKLVRGAYQARASMMTWQAKGQVTGAELARRWVAFRVFVFLIRCGMEETLAWASARCRDAFGEMEGEVSLTPAGASEAAGE